MRPLRIAVLSAALLSHCATPPPQVNVPLLTVPAIGLTRAVVVGDQQQIDEGNVVNYGTTTRVAAGPGRTARCGWRVIGPRTAASSARCRISRSATSCRCSTGETTFSYTVTDSAFVERINPPPDFMHGDLMVQTSWTDGFVLLVYADRTVAAIP